MRRRARSIELDQVTRAVARLELPDAVWKSVPWQPRELVATGLRQWLRCCGAALRDGQIVGMPSHAVDEAWHGVILCTELYATSRGEASVGVWPHRPAGGATEAATAAAGDVRDQLGRTVVAWTLVAEP